MSQEIFKEISFDAVIPSALLFNNNIEPNAIKLYAFVRGLTKIEGYCYATNSYLSDCMGCDESTVKRLLKSLKDEKFIEIETDKQGIHWQRRIYIGVDFKKCLRRLKNEPPPAQNRAPPSSKMSHNRRYTIEDIEKEETPPTPSKGDAAKAACVCSFGKFVKLSEEEYKELSENNGEGIVKDIIDQMNDYLASTGKKPYKDYAAAIRQWIRKRKDIITKGIQIIAQKNPNIKANRDYYFSVNRQYPDTYKHSKLVEKGVLHPYKDFVVSFELEPKEFIETLHRLFGVQL